MASIKLKIDNRKAVMFTGKPLADKPKSYKGEGRNVFHSIGNNYNPSTMKIWENGNHFKYEIYRDGSFYPYYGVGNFTNEYD